MNSTNLQVEIEIWL